MPQVTVPMKCFAVNVCALMIPTIRPVNDSQLQTPVAPAIRVRLREPRANRRVRQNLEHLRTGELAERQRQEQEQSLEHAAFTSQRQVNHVEWDAVQVLEDRAEVRLVGRLIRPVRQEHGNVPESEPLSGGPMPMVIFADQSPDLIGNDFRLAPDAGTPQDYQASVWLGGCIDVMFIARTLC